MSWIKRHPLLAIGALAFFLRASCAVVTEYKPIFPAYYYTDANLIGARAVQVMANIADGRSPQIPGTLSERLQTLLTLEVYRASGTHTLPIKLLNAFLGALTVAALTWALSLAFSTEVAWAAGLLVALWPSHIFYTSQNLKEAPADLLAYLALGAGLTAATGLGRTRSVAFAALAVCALLGAGFYRSYVLLSLSLGLLFSFGLMALERKPRRGPILGAATVCLSLCAYPWAAEKVLLLFESGSVASLLTVSTGPMASTGSPTLIPQTNDEFDIGTVNRPTSPEGITATRHSRQFADRRWARQNAGREIGTQIYPSAEFKTWGDVLVYLPKGVFTVLFMPLPGLYPLEGKVGRYAASGENLVLLILASLAGVGFIREPKTPARFGLLAFFCAMTIGASLLEFDLGSAGRHKLLYLPMLFPFAAEEIMRLLKLRSAA